MGVMVAQLCEYVQGYRTVHSKAVKLVSIVLYVLKHNFLNGKKKDKVTITDGNMNPKRTGAKNH